MASVMTPFPSSVALNTPLGEARRLTDEHGIHHLPVKREGELVGVVSARALEDRRTQGPEGQTLQVGDARIEDAQRFELHARLDDVAEHMAETHSTTVIVTREGKLAGIFTATDACRYLAEYLGERFPNDDDQIA